MARDVLSGFETRRVRLAGGEIFARVGGSGPAVLLMHGYPQTHVTWHKIAPELAKHVTLVMPDQRGYGASYCPPGDDANVTYSKRAVGDEMRALMAELGHTRFIAAGHDRGGRIAYRMALDHVDAVTACVPIDIVPTSEQWAGMNAAKAMSAYHWMFLAQPKPLPETLIGADAAFYVRQTLASWTRDKTLKCFDPDALKAYELALNSPERVHAVCSDYRAGATIDRAIDEADQVAGRKMTCPSLTLWGSDYIGRGGSPLPIWQRWADDIVGREIVSGHFLAEENPDAVLQALLPFLRRVGSLHSG